MEKEIKLLKADRQRMEDINAENKFAISYSELYFLIDFHKKGNQYTRKLIEYRLHDISRRHEVTLLAAGEYNKLKRKVRRDINSYLNNFTKAGKGK